MSFEATKAAWKCEGLTPTRKLVLLAIADRADKDALCWPSQSRIAADTGLCERSVRKALAELEQCALIARVARMGRHGRTSDLLDLRPLLSAHGASSAEKGSLTPVQSGSGRRDKSAPRPVSGAGTQRNSLPQPSGTSCRETSPEETFRENSHPARAGGLDENGVDTERDAFENTLFVIGQMPMPGDPMSGVIDRISDLTIAIGPEIGSAFELEAPGLRDVGPLAELMMRRPEADYAEALRWLAALWLKQGREPLRSWSLAASIIERRLVDQAARLSLRQAE